MANRKIDNLCCCLFHDESRLYEIAKTHCSGFGYSGNLHNFKMEEAKAKYRPALISDSIENGGDRDLYIALKEDQDKIIGLAHYIQTDTDTVWLDRLVMSHGYQHRGGGEALLHFSVQDLQSRCPHLKKLYVATFDDDNKIRFYSKRGFTLLDEMVPKCPQKYKSCRQLLRKL